MPQPGPESVMKARILSSSTPPPRPHHWADTITVQAKLYLGSRNPAQALYQKQITNHTETAHPASHLRLAVAVQECI
ncbi:hypothetical protein LMH87_007142 [Akanthomyces muscarius]|uniref:Uncharacterized protein n=1 Tax=Akanthomyces muscarius TaxID=2231603 RepID=A0A9W8QSI8_AKAMU|nr:hypothetical protein LMH87_007142 [Akanthomyces muscarius]KAJ4165512.1 hypothetical protein LMH87_007142 [Akanthomyces muscarius]